MRRLAAIVFFILACAGGPEAEGAEAYVAAMEPALVENSALAQRFLTEASRIKKKETDGSRLAEALSKELAPQADRLAKAVAAVQPDDPKLKDAHARVVKAWSDRAEAYAGLRDAWTHGDLVAWDAAMKKNTQAKLDEEAYFTDVNVYLAEYQLAVEQYPTK